MTGRHDRLSAARDRLAEKSGRESHDLAIVLGSGFGGYASNLTEPVAVPYAEIPGMALPSVVGHTGTAYSARIGESSVLVLAGRVHGYEGHDMETVTFGVRVAVMSGCRRVVLSNAAGGCDPDIGPGTLALITDHINLSGRNPLTGPNDDRLGPRFPDMTEVYSRRLRRLARAAAGRCGIELTEGVYFWTQGPMFETPAEIEVARRLGASLVGMSTVPEAIAARHMGAEVLGVSLCTNAAAGISDRPLSADDVVETARLAAPDVNRFLDELIPDLAHG